jgi:hypothetical protein
MCQRFSGIVSELNSIYKDALGFVNIKTQNTVTFPAECPYSLDQLLDMEWLRD